MLLPVLQLLLEVHLCELGFDLEYTVSESYILFGVVLYSYREIKKIGDGGGQLNPVLLDKAVSGI